MLIKESKIPGIGKEVYAETFRKKVLNDNDSLLFVIINRKSIALCNRHTTRECCFILD